MPRWHSRRGESPARVNEGVPHLTPVLYIGGLAVLIVFFMGAQLGTLSRVVPEKIPEREQMRLLRLVVVTRHGDRSPIHTRIGTAEACAEPLERTAFWKKLLLPNETQLLMNAFHPPPQPPEDLPLWPFGQLTRKGAQQLEASGAKLRKRYVQDLRLLPEELDTDETEIFIRSTDKLRTIQSAQHFMMGLYPSSVRHQGYIPIFVQPRNKETMYPNADGRCQREHDLIANHGSEGVTDLEELHEAEVREVCGIPSSSPVPWSNLRDLIHCRHTHGLPLGVSNEIKDVLEKYNTRKRNVWYKNKKVLRLAIGRFVGELVDMMVHGTTTGYNPQPGANPPKLALFSGHDTTLIPLLAALGVYNQNEWPDYGSMLVFELYGTKDVPTTVRVLFNNQHVVPTMCKREGHHPCTLEYIAAELKSLLPNDYDGECNLEL